MRWQVFDIIGPIMVGPSSSHTSGAVRLGLMANRLMGGVPDSAVIQLHGSYAEVYKGHGTDLALVAGLLGFEPDSEKVVHAFDEAKKQGLQYSFELVDLGTNYHPNTVRFVLKKGSDTLEMTGSSIGAGSVEIVELFGIPTSYIDGKSETLILMQQDRPGMVAWISSTIAAAQLNISQMSVARSQKGEKALTVINLDSPVPEAVLEGLRTVDGILWAKVLPILK